jgi:hypothetical protein
MLRKRSHSAPIIATLRIPTIGAEPFLIARSS